MNLQFTSVSTGGPATILVTREPFSDYYVLTLENGQTEELEVEEAKTWFREHGARMDAVDKAMDHCWNFYSVQITIADFRIPKSQTHAHAPKLE